MIVVAESTDPIFRLLARIVEPPRAILRKCSILLSSLKKLEGNCVDKLTETPVNSDNESVCGWVSHSDVEDDSDSSHLRSNRKISRYAPNAEISWENPQSENSIDFSRLTAHHRYGSERSPLGKGIFSGSIDVEKYEHDVRQFRQDMERLLDGLQEAEKAEKGDNRFYGSLNPKTLASSVSKETLAVESAWSSPEPPVAPELQRFLGSAEIDQPKVVHSDICTNIQRKKSHRRRRKKIRPIRSSLTRKLRRRSARLAPSSKYTLSLITNFDPQL